VNYLHFWRTQVYSIVRATQSVLFWVNYLHFWRTQVYSIVRVTQSLLFWVNYLHFWRTQVYSIVRVTRSLLFWVVFCWSLFVLLTFLFCLLCCVFFFLRFTCSDYSFSTIHVHTSLKLNYVFMSLRLDWHNPSLLPPQKVLWHGVVITPSSSFEYVYSFLVN
jgi:hypothetical protein